MTCITLALIASAAEIAVAVSLLPILASLGVDAGNELGRFIERLPPLGWLLLFAAAALVRSIVNWLSSVQDQRSSHALTVALQSRLYRALVNAHWNSVRHVSPPALTNALQTQAYSAGDGFSALVQVTTATFLVIGYIVSAALVFPLALPFVLVVLGIMLLVNANRSGRVAVHAEDYYAAQEELHQRYEDWVAISRIASLGVESDKLANRFEADARHAASHAVSVTHSTGLTRITYDAGVAFSILVGVPIAWQFDTPPALLAFGLLLLIRTLPRIANIHVGYQGMTSAAAPLRLIEKLAQSLESDSTEKLSRNHPLEWQRFELIDVGVENRIPDASQRWIVRNISFAMRHGEWLALAGPTGAGKTTLADVMLTLVRPDKGHLRIDSQNVDDDFASRWRCQAAYVPQDVVLFDASIRENLKLYAPESTDEELEEALRRSAADFVVKRLPDGLNTRVGPGGRWLSGGERQRIGIARALLRKPGFLVLDEPTAALDGDTQGRLMDALSGLEHTMSVVLITHRPELLNLVDRVIELRDGALQCSDPSSPLQ